MRLVWGLVWGSFFDGSLGFGSLRERRRLLLVPARKQVEVILIGKMRRTVEVVPNRLSEFSAIELLDWLPPPPHKGPVCGHEPCEHGCDELGGFDWLA